VAAPVAHHAAARHTAAVTAVTKPLSHPKPVVVRTVTHPVHSAKPAEHARHTVKKSKPAPRKAHVVRPVVTTATVTVHGVAGQVTLTKLRGRSSFALAVAGQRWSGIDLGQNRNQAIYSWVKNRSFDSVKSLTTQMNTRFPGATDKLPLDLKIASLAF
jgi:hypothetical protein